MNFRDYAPEQLREISRRAGIASGKARRKKRKAIEREKIKNAALREQRQENIRTLREAARLLMEYRKALEQAGVTDDHEKRIRGS